MTTMSDVISVLPALLVGMLLGGIFFGGLWLTVRKGLTSSRPALWFLGSFVVRTGAVLAGFLFVSNGSLEKILACLAGFLIARIVVRRLSGSAAELPSDSAKEVRHEA